MPFWVQNLLRADLLDHLFRRQPHINSELCATLYGPTARAIAEVRIFVATFADQVYLSKIKPFIRRGNTPLHYNSKLQEDEGRHCRTTSPFKYDLARFMMPFRLERPIM